MNDSLYNFNFIFTLLTLMSFCATNSLSLALAREKRPRKRGTASNLVSLYSVISTVIILHNSRTCASFTVSSVPRAASTAV